MAEIVQTVSPIGGSKPGSGGAAVGGRPVITQTATSGGARAPAAGDGGRPVIEQTVGTGAGGRVLSENTRKMLDNLDKHGNIHGKPGEERETKPTGADKAPDNPASGEKPAAAAPEAPKPAAKPAEAPPAAKPPEPPAAAPADDHKATADRYAARNRELVAEIEQLKAKPTKRELSKREQALDEIERGYLEDSIGSIRKLVALVAGIDDPKHKDVDAELSGLYQDLTARELGVSVDVAQQANRESARTRQLLAREQRERKAEQESASKPAPDDPDARVAAEHAQLIGNRLSSKQADGKAVADGYPALMRFSSVLHGHKPEALVLKVIRDGFATGEFDRTEQDEKLIEKAATKIEASYKTLYQALADVFGGASPSTATGQADATAKKDEGQSQAPRTITNASASVAPATPPAKQPEPKGNKPERKDFKGGNAEHDYRVALAKWRFGE